jgi:hypothetical protein
MAASIVIQSVCGSLPSPIQSAARLAKDSRNDERDRLMRLEVELMAL